MELTLSWYTMVSAIFIPCAFRNLFVRGSTSCLLITSLLVKLQATIFFSVDFLCIGTMPSASDFCSKVLFLWVFHQFSITQFLHLLFDCLHSCLAKHPNALFHVHLGVVVISIRHFSSALVGDLCSHHSAPVGIFQFGIAGFLHSAGVSIFAFTTSSGPLSGTLVITFPLLVPWMALWWSFHSITNKCA